MQDFVILFHKCCAIGEEGLNFNLFYFICSTSSVLSKTHLFNRYFIKIQDSLKFSSTLKKESGCINRKSGKFNLFKKKNFCRNYQVRMMNTLLLLIKYHNLNRSFNGDAARCRVLLVENTSIYNKKNLVNIIKNFVDPIKNY